MNAAEEAITQAGDAIVDMKYFTSSELPPAEVCRRAVGEADVYVAVVGFVYGSPVRDQSSKSYTELEFESAVERGIPPLAFLLGEETYGPSELYVDLQYGVRQNAFRRRIRESGITVSTVVSPHELQTGLLRALLALDAVSSGSDRQSDEWSFAHAAMCRRIAAVMVDMMRLLMVRSSVVAHRANNRRYEEFMKVARDHFEDLRHNIAALPAIGESRQYEKSREIELRFLWLLRTFAVGVSVAQVSPREVEVAREVMGLTIEYFNLHSGAAKDALNSTVSVVHQSGGSRLSIAADADDVFRTRQSLQTQVLATHRRDVGPGIMMDIDNELAVRYFAIDCWLLGEDARESSA